MARSTQLIILSAASQREDHGVELPANLKGEAARKVVDKLIREAARPKLAKPGHPTFKSAQPHMSQVLVCDGHWYAAALCSVKSRPALRFWILPNQPSLRS